jgi:hypothetical protein
VGQGQGEFTGSGNLTHLGLTASDTDVCNTPAACGGFSVSSQCAVFTAANGDELNGTVSEPYDNCFDPECGCLIGEALIDFSGGTGRFEDASGQATVVVTTTVDQFFNVVSVSSVFDGTIDY